MLEKEEEEEEEEDTKQAVEFNVTLSEECPERSEMEGAREETEVNKEMLRIATEWKRSTDAACRIRATLA
uniref:Uncharacterized protein n=1 Tax=Vespula pensylvanica TaxID=30213 RepID=A0A834JSX8_VESPE|nr:hypothetical protein H0235_016773 [Vespula pensylvanica]